MPFYGHSMPVYGCFTVSGYSWTDSRISDLAAQARILRFYAVSALMGYLYTFDGFRLYRAFYAEIRHFIGILSGWTGSETGKAESRGRENIMSTWRAVIVPLRHTIRTSSGGEVARYYVNFRKRISPRSGDQNQGEAGCSLITTYMRTKDLPAASSSLIMHI